MTCLDKFQQPTSSKPLMIPPIMLVTHNCVGLHCQQIAQHLVTSQEDLYGNNEGSEELWFYVSIALGSIVGFWGVCGTLVVKKSWRHAYFHFVDQMKDRLLW